MPTRLVSVVVDSADPRRLARWWAEALGWRISYEDDDETDIAPPEGERGVEMTFVEVPEPKSAQNRIHLDLRSEDDAGQAATVRRLEAAGARRIDVGQPAGAAWIPMADPEGNEFCVLEPRPANVGTGAVSAILVAAQEPHALADWWAEVAGWPLVERTDRWSALRAPDGRGPLMDFVPVPEPHTVKNRVHLDVAPFEADDHEAEVGRVLAHGARPADVGQPADASWTTLADSDGQEFCILSSRGPVNGETGADAAGDATGEVSGERG